MRTCTYYIYIISHYPFRFIFDSRDYIVIPSSIRPLPSDVVRPSGINQSRPTFAVAVSPFRVHNDNSDVIYLSSSSKGDGGGRHGVMIGFIGFAWRRSAVMRLKSQRARARITRFAAAHYIYFRVKSDWA